MKTLWCLANDRGWTLPLHEPYVAAFSDRKEAEKWHESIMARAWDNGKETVYHELEKYTVTDLSTIEVEDE